MSSTLTEVILPISLFIIMLGMGMTLVIDDFKRILIYPKAVSVGLLGQLIILPIVGFAIASLFPMSPELAVGIMILAACPGGVTSNVIAHLAKGDTALSITLTAISSLITVISIPLIISYSLNHFGTSGEAFSLSATETMLKLFVITILPITIGMIIRAKAEDFAQRTEKGFNRFATIVFVALVIVIVYTDRAQVFGALKQTGLASLVLNISMMFIGYLLARVFLLDQRQTKTITLEVGVQNTTLTFVIAGTILNNATYALPAAIYSLFMYASAGAFIMYFKKKMLTGNLKTT